MNRTLLCLGLGLSMLTTQLVAQATTADPTRAMVRTYGVGCQGSNGLDAKLTAKTTPYIGNQNFCYVVFDVCPITPVALVISTTEAKMPIGSCVLWIDPTGFVAQRSAVTDGSGSVTLPEPIPAISSLIGLHLFAQAAALDEKGEFLGIAALTNGLELMVGKNQGGESSDTEISALAAARAPWQSPWGTGRVVVRRGVWGPRSVPSPRGGEVPWSAPCPPSWRADDAVVASRGDGVSISKSREITTCGTYPVRSAR